MQFILVLGKKLMIETIIEAKITNQSKSRIRDEYEVESGFELN